jgi:hypothetical protein
MNFANESRLVHPRMTFTEASDPETTVAFPSVQRRSQNGERP